MSLRARTKRFGTRATMIVAVVACAPLVTPIATAEPQAGFTDIDGGRYAPAWTAAVDGPQPYAGIFSDLALPVTMSDGTVIKLDVQRPGNGGRATDEKLPTIIEFETYNKMAVNLASALLQIPGIEDVLLPALASVGAPPGSGLEGLTDLSRQLDSGLLQTAAHNFDLVKGGYNLVHVDIRGTGSSEGQWQLFGVKERDDAAEVIDWITRQPWSDGSIAVKGTSATGIAALRAADRGNPAIKAVFSYIASGDLVDDIVIPGGAVGFGFAAFWPLVVNLAKFAPDVEAIIAGRFDPAQQLRWFEDRLADPLTFMDVVTNAFTAMDTGQLTPKTRDLLDPDSDRRKGLQANMSEIAAPTFMVSAWWDVFGSTPTETYNDLALSPDRKKLIVGEGYHAGGGLAGFGHSGLPPRLDVLQRAWFDKWLKGIDNGIDRFNPITLKQQGGQWTSAPEFPRAQHTHRRMYLDDRHSGTTDAQFDGGLSAAPTHGAVTDLTVTPGLLSLCSRDTSRIWAGVPSIIMACDQDSRIWELNGLAFTSNPVTEPTVISGPINAHLNTVLDHPDGYWVVTVNDVFPDGRSREISAGQLVSSLRQIDDTKSTKSPNGDYIDPEYYLDLDRRELITPGQPLALDIGIDPTDAVLQPGHRLRIDVYASNLPKGLPPLPILVDSQLAPQRLRLDPAQPSWVNIPLSVAIPE
ncbi:CocE/NonD family hydrolase [Nocardia sp. NPDC051756]|uniref:CocE/NonD family hydrolase n=1 Tax=Nocardia sp. NPDC051756 TaxID=3154751 RepID=UPI00341267B3